MDVSFYVEVTPERSRFGDSIYGAKRVRFFRRRPRPESRTPDSHLTKVTVAIPEEYFLARASEVAVEVAPPRAIRAVS